MPIRRYESLLNEALDFLVNYKPFHTYDCSGNHTERKHGSYDIVKMLMVYSAVSLVYAIGGIKRFDSYWHFVSRPSG